MRKLNLLIFISCISCCLVKAQPWIITGNTIGGTDYIGGNASSTGDLDLKMRANFGMKLFTNDLERLRIMTHTINSVNYTRIGINVLGVSPITNPRSILHLGMNYLPISGAQGAWRAWMNVGTFSDVGSDFCYFGLVDNPTDTTVTLGSSDRTDAVVVWGDSLNGPEGADNLRFIFSSGYLNGGTPGFSNRWNSAEVARFTPAGRLGIGNFSGSGNTYPSGGNGSGVQPQRKLEIYDQHLDSINNSDAPQLRLT